MGEENRAIIEELFETRNKEDYAEVSKVEFGRGISNCMQSNTIIHQLIKRENTEITIFAAALPGKDRFIFLGYGEYINGSYKYYINEKTLKSDELSKSKAYAKQYVCN